MKQNSEKSYKQGVKYVATEIEQFLTTAIQEGALNKFEKYNYYDIEESKSMKKLGLHKWDIESLLMGKSSVEVSNHPIMPKDLEDYSYKTEKELRNLKTKLNKKITTEFNKGRSDSVEFKQSLSQLREVLHQLEVRKVTKEMIGIDIEKFHKDYVSRLWIDPKEETSLLRKEISTHLRENEGNGGPHLFTVLEHEKIAKDKKDILETYNSLKSFDKQKQWPLVKFYTEKLLNEISQVVKTNTEILAPNYNYNIPKKSKTLKKLGIDDFSVYLESNTNASLEDNLGRKDEQQHAEVTDSRSSIPDGQVDLNGIETISSASSLVDQDSRRTSLSAQEINSEKNLMNEVEQTELKPTFAMEIKKKFEEITKQHHVRQTNNELEKSNNKTNQRYESLSKNDNKLVEVQNKSIVDNYMNKPINSIHSEETKNGNIEMMAELSTPEVNTNEGTLVNKGSNSNRDNISELKKQKEKVIIQIKKNIQEFIDLISVETREANIKLNVNEIRIEDLRNTDNEIIAKNMSKALDHLCQKSIDMVQEMETDILQVQEKMSDNKELAYDFEKVDDLYDNYFFEDDPLEDNYKTINDKIRLVNDKIRILSYHLKNIMDVKNSPNNLSLVFNNIDMQLTNLEDIGIKMYRIENLQTVIANQLEDLERISERITSVGRPVIPPKPNRNQMGDGSVPVQLPFSSQKEGIKLSIVAQMPAEQKPSLSQKLQKKCLRRSFIRTKKRKYNRVLKKHS
ncbi:hypothetical protein BH747_08600 [Enterococcus villorum]|uniref:Uncharacterized protein n=1 Tax=Enterococcus villorum TaxID=112904 RepID=A0A1V8YUU8_9ENTE|nr:hypothetical protein [Enterococcus villorum]OQO69960.1 hypothetical protein BH747_08600 [Enterococcus villorum]OQO76412.1 hypothetical protein BH744_03110 [Enterococcus villorum]